MKLCRLCGKTIKDEETVCQSCGYNIVTDTVSPTFQPKPVASRNKERKVETTKLVVNPGIKKFALVGLIVVIFSIFYKYNFDINTIIFESKSIFSRVKSGKLFKDKSKKKGEETKKVELINVRSFDRYNKPAATKLLKIEGISFDPLAKSFVIINGKVVSEGEIFGNITVKKINKNSVELVIGGETKVLSVNQSISLP